MTSALLHKAGIGAVIQSSLAIAALSTLGDFIWATWIPRHIPAYGLTHGTLLFLGIGCGLVLALLGVGLTLITDDGTWDGLGTIAIGLLLVAIALAVMQWLEGRSDKRRTAATVIVAIVALAVGVSSIVGVVRIGDAGAEAVWGRQG